MSHVLSALVTNQPGVLAHISGMLASRAFNIDSLAVGETENPEFSRVTFVVNGDARVLDQVRKQLEKIVTVVKVLDFSNRNYVERDLMLIKVSTDSGITSGTGNGSRGEIRELVEIFRGRIVDVSPGHVMVEISGQERKLVSFIDLVRPYGIIEMVRTGRVALLRADQEAEAKAEASDDQATKATKADEPETQSD
jgi:acetolactate synthase-1/3 small subunit